VSKTSGLFGIKNADIPPVLIEVGFLSSSLDRGNLRDPEWRNLTISALAQAIIAWNADDMATRPLVRQ
jgi:N-acetylmuramoyl-L-alanine amidase